MRNVAIITDGNGRWAQTRGLPVNEGHEAGADTLKARLRDAIALGVRQLTVYSFSTENWARPADEVRGLMAMLGRRIVAETPRLSQAGIRMRFVGRRQGAPQALIEQMQWAEAVTASNGRLDLFIALNYGGRAEILDAARRFRDGGEDEFRSCLYTPDMDDPDLIIRTGGEQRLSNFLPWQGADAELVFREEMWPDFTSAAFAQSLEGYSSHGVHTTTIEADEHDPKNEIRASRSAYTVL
ncbi:MAG: polyprenyl diphosphate synthase [Solirubrobacteraceae bacterium]